MCSSNIKINDIILMKTYIDFTYYRFIAKKKITTIQKIYG
jgi:hypothetical protein